MKAIKADSAKTHIVTESIPKLFSCLTGEQYAGFCNAGQKIKLKAGAFLFQQEEPVSRCFVVVRGRLKLTKLNEEGKEVIIRYIDPGEVTAAITVLKDVVYPVTAETIEETDVIAWDKQSLMR